MPKDALTDRDKTDTTYYESKLKWRRNETNESKVDDYLEYFPCIDEFYLSFFYSSIYVCDRSCGFLCHDH